MTREHTDLPVEGSGMECPVLLCRWRAAQLERLTADASSFRFAAAQVRIVELELEVNDLRRSLETVNARLAATRRRAS